MARRRDRKSGYQTPTERRNETIVQRQQVTAPRSQRIRAAMAMVQDTSPGVRSPGQSAMSRVPSIPKRADPATAARTPGEAWDQAQNRTGEKPGQKPLDGRQCKAKPRSSKGNGTGRKFVPWCK